MFKTMRTSRSSSDDPQESVRASTMRYFSRYEAVTGLLGEHLKRLLTPVVRAKGYPT